MKKTLITLMAISGIACGATENSKVDDLALTIEGNYWAGAFTLNFTITEDITGDYDIIALYCGDRSGGSWNFNCFVLNNTDNGITLSLDRVKNVAGYENVNSETTYDGSVKDGQTLSTPENTSVFASEGTAITLQQNVDYTVKYLGGKNGEAAAELYSGDTLLGSFSGGSFNLSGGGDGGTKPMTWQSNEDYVTSVTIGNTTYAIPEPTTATLSLLALAGLAARRRRR